MRNLLTRIMKTSISCPVFLCVIICLSTSLSGQSSIRVDGLNVPYTQFSSFKLPESMLLLEAKGQGNMQVFLNDQLQSTFQNDSYALKVPQEIGLHKLRLVDGTKNVLLNLNLFVLTPVSQIEGGAINGFKMGTYPPPLGEGGKYERPRGLIEITKENFQTQLSPHFKLSQFTSLRRGKQEYIVIREVLLLKLEYLLKEINNAGIPARTIRIRKAYLTPEKNALKGNAIYSRHIYGDAAQIIIDENNDGIMDDVNGDGKTDMKDARWLFELIDKLSGRKDYQRFEGGLAHYKLNKKFGGYVYIDARGNKVRY